MDAVDNVTEGLRKMFMAGVGAVAAVGEKGGQVIESFAERGENVVKQGKDLNQELVQKSVEATSDIREDVVRTAMSVMSPEGRARVVEMVTRIAAELDEKDAAKVSAAEPAEAVPVDVEPCGCGCAEGDEKAAGEASCNC